MEERGQEAVESYDEWADRIYKAFTARRKPPAHVKKPEAPGAKTSLRPEVDLAQAEETYRLLKEARLRDAQRKMCRLLFEGEGEVCLGSIPFKVR